MSEALNTWITWRTHLMAEQRHAVEIAEAQLDYAIKQASAIADARERHAAYRDDRIKVYAARRALAQQRARLMREANALRIMRTQWSNLENVSHPTLSRFWQAVTRAIAWLPYSALPEQLPIRLATYHGTREGGSEVARLLAVIDAHAKNLTAATAATERSDLL